MIMWSTNSAYQMRADGNPAVHMVKWDFMTDEYLSSSALPEWRRPIITAVAIAEVTLGKLGSLVDLGGENNFSPD